MLIALPGFGGDPWRSPLSKWTEEDATRILRDSPWAKPLNRSRATIRWETARPVQLAMEKLKIHRPAGCVSCYAVALVGFPTLEGGPKPSASLKATGRKPIAAFETRTDGHVTVFFFPRIEELTEPIVFRLPVGVKFGNDIEFEGRIGAETVRQKFSLGTMTWQGKLEL
jgi:hypothetical protein